MIHLGDNALDLLELIRGRGDDQLILQPVVIDSRFQPGVVSAAHELAKRIADVLGQRVLERDDAVFHGACRRHLVQLRDQRFQNRERLSRCSDDQAVGPPICDDLCSYFNGRRFGAFEADGDARGLATLIQLKRLGQDAHGFFGAGALEGIGADHRLVTG